MNELQQALAEVAKGYAQGQTNPLAALNLSPSSERIQAAKDLRTDVNKSRSILSLASLFKGGSIGNVDGIGLSFLGTRHNDSPTPGYETHTSPLTPTYTGDRYRLNEINRESNQDGRSASTFFDEAEREWEQDTVETPTPFQTTGPPDTNDKLGGYFSDTADHYGTPNNHESPITQMPPRKSLEAAGAETDRSMNVGLGKFDEESDLSSPRQIMKMAGIKYRPRVEVFLRDLQGRVLAGRSPGGNLIFPGGGIEGEETPIAAGKREVLEEVGRRLKRPRVVHGPVKMDWTSKQKKDQKGDKGYGGSETTYVVANDSGRDTYLHGGDGGFKMRASFRSIDKIIADLKKTEATGHAYAGYDRSALAALMKLHPTKTANNSSGEASFDDKGTQPETSISKTEGARLVNTRGTDEWRDSSNMTTVDRSFQGFDSPQVTPTSFEFFA